MTGMPGSRPATGRRQDAPKCATGLIEGYLADVAARLPGPARARAGIITELRGGLLDAADAHHDAGLPAGEATLASAARLSLAGRSARRCLAARTSLA